MLGLSQLNIELTSRCGKRTLCFMCGHQDPKIHPNIRYGDLDFDLLKKIHGEVAGQGLTIEWHRDGDPLDYPRLRDALLLFKGEISVLVTHGERLSERAYDIIGQCTTVCVSIIKGDPDHEIQYESVVGFLDKRDVMAMPRVILKFVGDIEESRMKLWQKLGLPITSRTLHVRDGNSRYIRNHPIMPESGICSDFLSRPAIDWQGRVFQCVKLDVNDSGYLGDIKENTLQEILQSPKRMAWLEAHKSGRRDLASPLCRTCLYWGVPSGN